MYHVYILCLCIKYPLDQSKLLPQKVKYYMYVNHKYLPASAYRNVYTMGTDLSWHVHVSALSARMGIRTLSLVCANLM